MKKAPGVAHQWRISPRREAPGDSLSIIQHSARRRNMCRLRRTENILKENADEKEL